MSLMSIEAERWRRLMALRGMLRAYRKWKHPDTVEIKLGLHNPRFHKNLYYEWRKCYYNWRKIAIKREQKGKQESNG